MSGQDSGNLARIAFIFASFLLSAVNGQNNSIGCFVSGECEGAFSVGISQASSPQDCLSDCNATLDCNFFTHYSANGACLHNRDCPLLASADCTDCVSGDVGCIAGNGPTCNITGQCQGVVESFEVLPTLNLCVDACKDLAACNYWSYDTTNGFCSAYSECNSVNEDCTTCISGEKDCDDPHLTCGAIGQCEGSILEISSTATTTSECNDFCLTVENCAYWTFYGDQGYCTTYASCEQHNENCNNCFYGESGCSGGGGGELACDEAGICVSSNLLNYVTVADKAECIDDCKLYPGCEFWTHQSDTSKCSMWSDCSEINPTCTTCTSGERDCPVSRRKRI